MVGGVATFLRRSVQEHCPPGSINWAKLCDPSSWLGEEEPEEKPATVVGAAPVATVAPAVPAAEPEKGRGKGKVKVKAKPKPRAREEEESYSYEEDD